MLRIPDTSAAMTRWRKRQAKSTKCSPATVAGNLSWSLVSLRKRVVLVRGVRQGGAQETASQRRAAETALGVETSP